MLKLITLAALSCGVAGGAFAQTPSERLVGGTWVCTAISEGMNVVSKQSYDADGASLITVLVFGGADDTAVRIAAEGKGRWSFVGDRLDETLSELTARFAEIGGQEAITIAQDLLNSMMVNVPLQNTATFKDPTLQLIDGDGVVTDCVR